MNPLVSSYMGKTFVRELREQVVIPNGSDTGH